MPSLRTRQAYQNIILSTAQDALGDAAAAVADATETLGTVQDTITDIQAGTLDLDAVTVGGKKFINVGDELVPEP
jgi:hypothetical protein